MTATSLLHAGEALIGARAYRVIFALISLPLASVAIFYFINHRYDGIPLWDLRGVPGVHELVWVLSFVSFFFLYPSTFNILEVCVLSICCMLTARACCAVPVAPCMCMVTC